jgi:hypothetical protein
MTTEESIAGRAGARPPALNRQARLGVALLVVFAVVLWGGYSHTWSWTGINGGTATLWDWLHLLLLPVAVAVLPVWFRHDTRVSARTKRWSLGALAVFAGLVVVGYLVPWAWTGFLGNTLWDWLNLAVLPLAVLTLPWVFELRHRWEARHSFVAGTLLVVFIALVVGAYAAPWSWTGFTGNTLWNWLNLLFLPLLLPALIVPVTARMMLREVVYLDAKGNPIDPDAPVIADVADAPDAPAAVDSPAPAAEPGT